MSLRQKGIEALFQEFLKNHTTNFEIGNLKFSKNLSLEAILINQEKLNLYQKTIELLNQDEKKIDFDNKKETSNYLDNIRQCLSLKNFYFLWVNYKEKKIDLIYNFPQEKNYNSLVVNQAFLNKIKNKQNDQTIVNGLKVFFNIDFEYLNLYKVFQDKKIVAFIFYRNYHNIHDFLKKDYENIYNLIFK